MNDEPKGSLFSKITKANREGGPFLIVRRAFNLAIEPFNDTWSKRAWRLNMRVLIGRRLLGRPVVHAMGDSHSQILAGVSPFVVTWLGAATAFNVTTPGSSTHSYEQVMRALRRVDKKRDVVLFILGEVDTRIHIYYQYMKRGQVEPMTDLMLKTINRYGEFLLGLRQQGYRIVVHSVSATPYWDNAFDYPFYADDETRAWIVGEYNKLLSAWCAENGVEYLDMYQHAADERGFIKLDLTEDQTHLGSAALPLYQQWVKENVETAHRG